MILSALLAAFFCGCVSAPRPGQLQSYNISGTAYFSLASLCDLKNIKCDYDLLSRTAELNRDSHRIKIQTGGKTVFVDGAPRELSDPVDLYRGMLVVPQQLRQIVESLFPSIPPDPKQ